MANCRTMFAQVVVLIAIIAGIHCDELFGADKHHHTINQNDLRHLEQISEESLKKSVGLGVDSISKEQRLEQNLQLFKIIVENGSISHAQFLETHPSNNARTHNEIAQKILKSSLYVANSDCRPKRVNSKSCEHFISGKQLPKSNLRDECLKVTQNPKEGHRGFRRLLPPKYKDGFYSMFSSEELPSPRTISNSALHSNPGSEDSDKNMAFIQWTQFIEHDLVKSVANTMKNGAPIECCTSNHMHLSPRFEHPACAPMDGEPNHNPNLQTLCLNYVRSALAVDPKCNFGAAKQLNQATGLLDLSQLYGVTKKAEKRMRSFVEGELKVTKGSGLERDFLPVASEKHNFCVISENSLEDCFMAGDTRVNNNPLVTTLYTIFLRSHNQIAKSLKLRNPSWSDEQLYQEARRTNVATYRSIVFDEWLPVVIGKRNADRVKSAQLDERSADELDVSNEFGVAAMRFYYSMMPNVLRHHHKKLQLLAARSNYSDDVLKMEDEYYQSTFLNNPSKFDHIVEAILKQRALKMDSMYTESLIKTYLRTNLTDKKISGSDVLALDIQRARDHGLQGYVEYLQACEKKNISSWEDLREFINEKNVEKLKGLYRSVGDVDLIVGGISEVPMEGSTVGPTFACILGEQFAKIRQLQFSLEGAADEKHAKSETLSNLICATTDAKEVPQNYFLVPSETNALIPCSNQ